LTAADLVVYDDVAQQYWIRDLGTFNFMTYNEQINKIADINANSDYQDPFWGEWRMATESDMENLWEYSAEEITESFDPSDDDLGEISGRYEKANIAYSEGEEIEQHYWVQTSRIGPFKQDLPGNLIPDDVGDLDFLGAWVVADATQTLLAIFPTLNCCSQASAGLYNANVPYSLWGILYDWEPSVYSNDPKYTVGMDVQWPEGNTGFSVYNASNSPDFDEVAARLTDDVDEYIWDRVLIPVNPPSDPQYYVGGTGGGFESGRITEYYELYGASIDYIRLVVETNYIEQINWTETYGEVKFNQIGKWEIYGTPIDTDGDGVPDADESCPGTATGVKVDQVGCSGEQLVDLACPCESDWKNHGKFVSCVAHSAEEQVNAGLITQSEKDAIVSARAESGCGHKAINK
jgi:hypothetical protein